MTRQSTPIGLPRLLIITDRHQLPQGRSLIDTVADAARSGPCLVALRDRDLSPDARSALTDRLRGVLRDSAGDLVLQLPANGSMPTPRPPVVGRSCHTAAELVRARDDGCDYATLSPVAVSASKPGYGPALGACGLRGLLSAVPDHPPVFALGGVTATNACTWLDAGAYGVAVMGTVMRARTPAAVCAQLHRELDR